MLLRSQETNLNTMPCNDKEQVVIVPYMVLVAPGMMRWTKRTFDELCCWLGGWHTAGKTCSYLGQDPSCCVWLKSQTLQALRM